MMSTLIQDLRFGARQLRSNPGFTAVAVLSLALGIGANSAIFQLVDAVRLRALPVREPEQLVTIDFAKGSNRSGNFSTRSARLTSVLWDQLKAHDEPFSGMFAWSATRFNLVQGGQARYAEGLYVSPSFFPVLGVNPMMGRTFATEEDRPGCGTAPGAVISYPFWQREFAGQPGVIGREIALDGRRFPIIGVTPPEFFGVEVGHRFDVAVPLCSDPANRAAGRTQWWLSAMGRMKSGWSVDRTTTYLKSVSPAITEATLPPSYRPQQAQRFRNNKIVAEAAANGISGLRREYENPLWLLLAATGLVLLIACGNLANLLLARGSVREREIAVRQAIGASRGRLVLQLLSESLLLSVLGTALGVALAQVLSRALLSFLSTSNESVFVGLGMDLRMLGFAAAIATVTCLLFGLLPAVRATRVAPASAMRGGGRGTTAGRERNGLRRALVTGQVALSLVLLVGAVLFVRSLQNLLNVQPGFRPEGILMVDADFGRGFPKERRLAAFQELQDRVAQQPGVLSVAQVGMTPMSGSGWNESVRPDSSTEPAKNSFFNRFGPGYLKTMGIGLIAGRDFTDRDNVSAPQVAVVNEAFAKTFYNSGNPVGHTFRVEGSAGQPDRVYEVVGLIRNTKYYELREDFLPTAFFPIAQDKQPGSDTTLMVRASGPPREVFAAAKSAAAAVNPQIVLDFRVMSAQIGDTLLRDRLMATLAGAFGVLAALLAAIGLYGVIAYMVARRQNEIGVRMALGANAGSVVRLVLREAMMLLAVGLVIGTALALWAGKAADKMLFGLKPNDALTFVAAGLLLAVAALAAGYIPARRASRLDPMNALRME